VHALLGNALCRSWAGGAGAVQVAAGVQGVVPRGARWLPAGRHGEAAEHVVQAVAGLAACGMFCSTASGDFQVLVPSACRCMPLAGTLATTQHVWWSENRGSQHTVLVLTAEKNLPATLLKLEGSGLVVCCTAWVGLRWGNMSRGQSMATLPTLPQCEWWCKGGHKCRVWFCAWRRLLCATAAAAVVYQRVYSRWWILACLVVRGTALCICVQVHGGALVCRRVPGVGHGSRPPAAAAPAVFCVHMHTRVNDSVIKTYLPSCFPQVL